MRLISPNENDEAWHSEWRMERKLFSIDIEPDGKSAWWYLDYTEQERIHESGDIDMETLRKLYGVLKVIFYDKNNG